MEQQLVDSSFVPNLCFLLVTIVVISSAAVTAFSSSIVRAAYSLFFTLFAMSGYYVLLGSGFLAITQVIIYVGGILVLLLFGVLLTERPLEKELPKRKFFVCSAIFCCLLLAALLVRAGLEAEWKVVEKLEVPTEGIAQLGRVLLGDYSLMFMFSGVTLLLCLIGAAYLVRRKER